jgi:hypothetical protein
VNRWERPLVFRNSFVGAALAAIIDDARKKGFAAKAAPTKQITPIYGDCKLGELSYAK